MKTYRFRYFGPDRSRFAVSRPKKRAQKILRPFKEVLTTVVEAIDHGQAILRLGAVG